MDERKLRVMRLRARRAARMMGDTHVTDFTGGEVAVVPVTQEALRRLSERGWTCGCSEDNRMVLLIRDDASAETRRAAEAHLLAHYDLHARRKGLLGPAVPWIPAGLLKPAMWSPCERQDWEQEAELYAAQMVDEWEASIDGLANAAGDE